MTRKRIVRRTAGTVLLLLSLGLTNCQAVVGTLVSSAATPTPAGVGSHA